MPHFAILRVKKHSSVQNLIGSLKHNFREIPTPNADATRTPFNAHYRPKSDEFWQENAISHSENTIRSSKRAMAIFNNRIDEISKNSKIRKNAVLAVEYLLTTSPDWWTNITDEQFQEWLKKNIDFIKQKHGIENIIAATFQRDETTPHISVFVVPEINGKLNARHFFGGRQKMSALQTEYANNMTNLGLSRGIENSKATHQTIKQYYSKINSFYKHEFNKNYPELLRAIKTQIKIPEKKLLESQHEYNKKVYDTVFKQVYSLIYGQYRKYKKIHFDLVRKHDELVKLETKKREFQQKMIDDEVKKITAKLTEELKFTRETNDMLQSMFDKSQDDFYEQKILISNLEDELFKKDRLLEQKDCQLNEQQKILREHQQAFESLCEQLKAVKQELNDLKRGNEPKKMDWRMNENDPF